MLKALHRSERENQRGFVAPATKAEGAGQRLPRV